MRCRSFVFLGAAALTGCAGVDVAQYQQERPELRLETYFNGTIDGWGMFQKRDGSVVKRFKVVIDARWEGDQGVLDEAFTYSDGTRQRRVWYLTRLGDGRYSGRAEDVIGSAKGQVSGNALHWTYTLSLPVGNKVYAVNFDDWMYLQQDGLLLNRAVMKKFGIRLGEVTLAFKRRES
jgi:hypothetical protein